MKIALKKSQKKMKKYIDKKEDSIVQSGRQSIIKYKEFGMVDEEQKDKEVDRKICETIENYIRKYSGIRVTNINKDSQW